MLNLCLQGQQHRFRDRIYTDPLSNKSLFRRNLDIAGVLRLQRDCKVLHLWEENRTVYEETSSKIENAILIDGHRGILLDVQVSYEVIHVDH